MMRRLRLVGLASTAALCFGLTAPATAHAQVGVGVSISVGTAPPPLLVYDQPPCPGPDYMWVPGYWAWGDGGYYWVPGSWVVPPDPGLLWTPGYWGFNTGVYLWHPGYWGHRVGYYGGINYGFGYFGSGFVGGFWVGDHFRYNTAVMHVNTRYVHNVYIDRRVVMDNHRFDHDGDRYGDRDGYRYGGHDGYYGGRDGYRGAPPRGGYRDDMRPMTNGQREHEWVSGQDRNQFQAVTHGHPRQTAVDRPFTRGNRPSTFEQMRPSDRVAPQGRGGGGGWGGPGGGHGGGPGGGHGGGQGRGQGGGHGGGRGHNRGK